MIKFPETTHESESEVKLEVHNREWVQLFRSVDDVEAVPGVGGGHEVTRRGIQSVCGKPTSAGAF